MMIGGFGLFAWSIDKYSNLEIARTMVVNALVMGEIAYLLNTREIGSSLNWNIILGNALCIVAIFFTFVLQLFFTYFPWMQNIFGTANLSISQWCYVCLFGVILFLLVELEKYLTGNMFSRNNYKHDLKNSY